MGLRAGTSAPQRLQVALPLLHATCPRLSKVVSAITGRLEWVSLLRPGTRAVSRAGGWKCWARATSCADALCLADPRGAARGGAGNAGHASLDTTARYVTTEAARRMAAMLAVWGAG